MFAQMLSAFDFSQFGNWVIPGAGITSAGLALLVGTFLSKGRSRRLATSATEPTREHRPERDPFDHGSATEKRSALRRMGNHIPVWISDAESKTQARTGWVLDRSTTGLGLAYSEEVKPGTILSLRANNAPETAPWVQVEVKRCKSDGSHWELGCQYLRTPSWSVMLLFG